MTQLGRRQFTGLLLGAVFAPFGALARAAIDPAETYVSRIADEVMNLANGGQRGDALLNRFSSLLSRHISLRNIANYALGTYRSQLPAGRREEFYRLVNNYAAALFVFYINDFKGSTLDITSTTKQGNFTVILSAIKGRGSSEPVRWRLTGGGGGYRVEDINIKGVWLKIAMKDRFTKVLKRSKGDFEPLFKELREAETW